MFACCKIDNFSQSFIRGKCPKNEQAGRRVVCVVLRIACGRWTPSLVCLVSLAIANQFCHFRDYKTLLGSSLSRVRSAIGSFPTFDMT